MLSEEEVTHVFSDQKKLWSRYIVYTIINDVFYSVYPKGGEAKGRLYLSNDSNRHTVAIGEKVSDLMRSTNTPYFAVVTNDEYMKEQAIHKFRRNLTVQADGRNYYIESLYDSYRLDYHECGGCGYDILVEYNGDLEYLFTASDFDDAIRSLYEYEYEQKLPYYFKS